MRLHSKLLYSDNKDTSLKKVKTKMKNKCFFVDFSVLRFKKMNPSALCGANYPPCTCACDYEPSVNLTEKNQVFWKGCGKQNELSDENS